MTKRFYLWGHFYLRNMTHVFCQAGTDGWCKAGASKRVGGGVINYTCSVVIHTAPKQKSASGNRFTIGFINSKTTHTDKQTASCNERPPGQMRSGATSITAPEPVMTARSLVSGRSLRHAFPSHFNNGLRVQTGHDGPWQEADKILCASKNTTILIWMSAWLQWWIW